MKDRDARITELFEAHASRLYAYARRHAGSDEAQDLVADAFASHCAVSMSCRATAQTRSRG